jgi:hypothetical protein
MMNFFLKNNGDEALNDDFPKKVKAMKRLASYCIETDLPSTGNVLAVIGTTAIYKGSSANYRDNLAIYRDSSDR